MQQLEISLILLLIPGYLFSLSPQDSLIYQILSETLTFPHLPQATVYDQQGRAYLYVAAKDGGLYIWDVNDLTSPMAVDTILSPVFDSLHIMNMHQHGNYLYLALGNFFGNAQQHAGMAIVDVQNPHQAVMTDMWTADTLVKGSAVIKAQGDYVYLGAMTMGLIVLNVSDKTNIQFVTEYLPDINFPRPNPNEVQKPNARGMDIVDSLLYLCYDAGGIRVIDVSDPAQPTEISHYINQDALNTQQAYNNITIFDSLAYVAVDYCGMEILNISKPDSIFRVGWWNPWECEKPSNIWINSPGHTNQIVYKQDQQLVFMSSGKSEMSVVDVSDPANPVACNEFGSLTNNQAVWGISLHQNYVFLSYINAIIPFIGTWSGVKILEWSRSSTPIEEDWGEFGFRLLDLYPNPASNMLRLEMDISQTNTLQIEILDLSGKLVKRFPPAIYSSGENLQNISLQDLASGIYLLRVKHEQGEIARKFLKK